MLSHRSNNEREFIPPMESMIKGEEGHTTYELAFYANSFTSLSLKFVIDHDTSLITHSHFYFTTHHKKKQYCEYSQIQGVDVWHNYALIVYKILYKEFML